jgi:hypothetical protein
MYYYYLEWAVISLLVSSLFDLLIQKKNGFRAWLLIIVAILPITIMIAGTRVFLIHFLNPHIDFVLLCFEILPTVIVIGGITVTIKFLRHKKKKRSINNGHGIEF